MSMFQLTPELLICIGIGLMVIEAVMFGFGTLYLLFVGLACFVSAAGIHWQWFAPTFENVFICLSISTLALTALLWRPLQVLRHPKTEAPQKSHSDFVGLQFQLTEANQKEVSYSGIRWQLVHDSTQLLAAGDTVEVIDVQVGQFVVKKV